MFYRRTRNMSASLQETNTVPHKYSLVNALYCGINRRGEMLDTNAGIIYVTHISLCCTVHKRRQHCIM